MRSLLAWLLLAGLLVGCTHGSSGARQTAGASAPNSASQSIDLPGGASEGASGACPLPKSTVTVQPSAADAARVTQVLSAFAARGWNSTAVPAKPSTLQGGLFVNYTPAWTGHGDARATTNVRTTGESDSDAGVSARHDPLTDLSLLRDISAYLAAGMSSPAIVQLRCELIPVTQAEFATYGVARGWVYQQLAELSELDVQGAWRSDALRLASLYAKLFSDPTTLGASAKKPVVRTDWIAESAAALVDAGVRFSQPAWQDEGLALASTLVQAAANPATGLFPGELKLSSNGRFTVEDPLVKVGAQAQTFDALMSVYQGTKSAPILAAVAKGLASLQSPRIGLIDSKHGGWFYAANADGSGVRTAYKETRQAWMLPLLRDVEAELPQYSAQIASFTTIVRDQMYQNASGGYVYRTNATWGPYVSKVKGEVVREDWVTSEATGIAIDVLLGPLIPRG